MEAAFMRHILPSRKVGHTHSHTNDDLMLIVTSMYKSWKQSSPSNPILSTSLLPSIVSFAHPRTSTSLPVSVCRPYHNQSGCSVLLIHRPAANIVFQERQLLLSCLPVTTDLYNSRQAESARPGIHDLSSNDDSILIRPSLPTATTSLPSPWQASLQRPRRTCC